MQGLCREPGPVPAAQVEPVALVAVFTLVPAHLWARRHLCGIVCSLRVCVRMSCVCDV
jgi:hypothetical protein